MSDSTRKQDMFNTMAANLRLYWPNDDLPDESFLCPLCLRLFSGYEENKASLSIAHTLPRFIKARRSTTVTCKECNSSIGTRIESAEQAYLRTSADDADIVVPNAHFIVRTTMSEDLASGGMFRFRANHGGGPHIHVDMPDGRSNPAVGQLMHSIAASGKQMEDVDLRVTVELRLPDHNRIGSLTYLHAAFLTLFREYGYEWILSAPAAQAIREQLADPQKQLITPFILHGVKPETLAGRVCVIRYPTSCKGLLVGIEEVPHRGGLLAVWLPMPLKKYPDEVAWTSDSKQTVRSLPLVRTHLHDPRSRFSLIRSCHPKAKRVRYMAGPVQFR